MDYTILNHYATHWAELQTQIETTIGKVAAKVALKSYNNLWKETKKEGKKTFCVCLDFISSELNLITLGDCKRVIIRIS